MYNLAEVYRFLGYNETELRNMILYHREAGSMDLIQELSKAQRKLNTAEKYLNLFLKTTRLSLKGIQNHPIALFTSLSQRILASKGLDELNRLEIEMIKNDKED